MIKTAFISRTGFITDIGGSRRGRTQWNIAAKKQKLSSGKNTAEGRRSKKMNEIASTSKSVAPLDSLATQARMYVMEARLNLLQLGRVLSEAKPLVPHGEWDAWIRENADMSRRTAEAYMQAYAKFGADPTIAKLGTSKVMKLLPMPGEQVERLFAENDVEKMSVRQLDEAIKAQKEKLLKEAREEARKEVEQELERERLSRIAAEKRADLEAEEKKEAAKQFAEDFQASVNDRMALTRRNRELQQDLQERDKLLQEQQDDFNRMQAELLDVKSSIAKGDAERTPTDRLTVDAFASAVRTFIGAVARMPHMGSAFSAMEHDEKMDYDELLRTVEAWAQESRKALDSAVFGSEVII